MIGGESGRCGAHVLDGGHRAGRHQLQRRFDQELFRERVAFIADESGSRTQVIDQRSDRSMLDTCLGFEEEEDRIDGIDLSDGTISVVAGYGRKPEKDCIHRDGIEATKSCPQYPSSLAVDAYGNLFIGEMSEYLREVNLGSGLISTVNGNRRNRVLVLWWRTLRRRSQKQRIN